MLDIFVSDKSSAKFFSKFGKLTASILDDWEDDWGVDTGFVGVFSLLLLSYTASYHDMLSISWVYSWIAKICIL